MTADHTAEAIDKFERAAGAAERVARDFSNEARDFVERTGNRVGDTYATARELAATVDPFVKERPVLALALAIMAGVIIGGLFFQRGPKVIYVQPRP